MSNPFYTDIIRVIEEQVTARGYTLVMQQIGTCDDEVKRGAMMEREKRLRGLILLGGRSDYTPQELAPLNIPYVCCSYDNQYGTLPPDSYASVSIADEEEACRAVTELYRCGHRRIAALVSGTEDRSISQLRYQGYVRALAAHGLPLEQELVIEAGSFDIRQSYLGHAAASAGGGAVYRPVRHLRQHGHRGHAGFAGGRTADPRGLLRHRHRRTDHLGLHQPHPDHPLPAYGAHGRRSVEILLDMVEHRGGPIRETAHTTLRTGESVRDIS